MPENNNRQKENRFALAIIAFILLIALSMFIKIYYGVYEGGQVRITVPVGLIAIFISFYIFREYNRLRKARREERRDELNARRQELLDNVIKAKQKDELPGD